MWFLYGISATEIENVDDTTTTSATISTTATTLSTQSATSNLSTWYNKDRLNNLVSLSPSCMYGLSYSGKETQPKLFKIDSKLRSGVRYCYTNKHQLLNRIQSVRTSLIFNT